MAGACHTAPVAFGTDVELSTTTIYESYPLDYARSAGGRTRLCRGGGGCAAAQPGWRSDVGGPQAWGTIRYTHVDHASIGAGPALFSGRRWLYAARERLCRK